ncbi:MAG: site-specific integrase [Nitrospiraceae bacterium]|nr:site-specific integrase [Nitrospiraceae bacterium]
MAKGIYKRDSIYWIRYAGLDGRIIRESSGSEKFREAESLLISRKEAIKQGKQPETLKIENHTFTALAAEYLKWSERQRGFRQKRQVTKQLQEVFGPYPLRKFNTMLVEQYQSGRLQKGNKPATINRYVATLKHMFTKAVDWFMVEEEILKRVRKVKLLEENNRRLRYLSKEECAALADACDSHLEPIVITALNTGMRKGEILSLTWDRVDLKHGFILLDRTKNGERREIPINDTLRAALQGLTRRLDISHVFYGAQAGKAYQDVKRSFQTALKKAGICDFRFHDLRHTFASHLVMAGVDLTTVKELLGHKSLAMTLRYSHLAPSHKVKAVNILDSALNKPTAQKLHNLGVAANV